MPGMSFLGKWLFTFRERGGWWVLAQFPLILAVILLAEWTGRPFADAARIWVIAGGVICLAGTLLFIAATATLGSAMTPFPRPVEKSRLRTRGVYAMVRHPIYTSVLLMGSGWALLRLSGLALIAVLVLFVFFDRKAAREERWLMERFPEYSEYRVRVCKLIPWIY